MNFFAWLIDKFHAKPAPVFDYKKPKIESMTDIVSENRLLQLHPAIRDKGISAYQDAVNKTPAGVHPFVTETLRSFERSNQLYAQGRTAPGKIVTNSKAGQSYHNFGLAIDLVIQVNGLPVWTVNDNWMIMINAFINQGFVWGGNFKSIKDYPHVEMTLGHNWRDLLAKYNAGDKDSNGYVILD